MAFCRCSNPSTAEQAHLWPIANKHTHTNLCHSLHFKMLQHFLTFLPRLPGHCSICCPQQLSHDYTKATVNNNCLDSLSSLSHPFISPHLYVLPGVTLFLFLLWCQIHLGPLHQPPPPPASGCIWSHAKSLCSRYDADLQGFRAMTGFISLDITDGWHVQCHICHGYLPDAVKVNYNWSIFANISPTNRTVVARFTVIVQYSVNGATRSQILIKDHHIYSGNKIPADMKFHPCAASSGFTPYSSFTPLTS